MGRVRLFDDASPQGPPSIKDNINETGPSLTKSEVIHVIKKKKTGKLMAQIKSTQKSIN